MKKIKLTQGKYALVDDEDFEWLNQWKWFYGCGGYAVRKSPRVNGKQSNIWMHRLIMNTPKGKETDHKNGIGWDNQKHNLRTATHSQNQMNKKGRSGNSSKYKGVCWKERDQHWCAAISLDGKIRWIGSSICEVEAAKIYDKKAKELHGEFAYLNFKEEV